VTKTALLVLVGLSASVCSGAAPTADAAFVSRQGDQEPDIKRYIELVTAGQLEEVEKDLPALLEEYPDNPGVLYLQALTTTEGSEAVKQYQNIVDKYPRSEWADDALYKIRQFYQALGLVRTAELKMAQLRREYPRSRYVTGRAEPDLAEAGQAPQSPRPVVKPPSSTKSAPPSGSRPSPAPAVLPPAASGRDFALQVGAFSAETNAGKLRRQFSSLGYPVEVIKR